MKTLRFITRMTWRETRATWRRLLLLTAAVTAGVAALVAINSFADNLRRSVAEQSRALLGADLAFRSRTQFSPKVDSLIDSLAQGGAAARTAQFAAMAYIPRTTGARLVQVTAVEPGYPFYGEIRTAPANAWHDLHSGQHVVVEPSFLASLGAQVGDTLSLGAARLLIAGTAENIPGDVGVRSAFGARVFIPYAILPETELMGFGSRVEHSTFVRLAPSRNAIDIVKAVRPRLRPERVGVRTVEEDQQNLTRSLTQLTDYLGLVALVALLLGGLGVASAVTVFIRRKLDVIAVLRCLGASAGAVLTIYLAQAALMGLGGAALGAGIGLAVQQILPMLLRDFLPVDVSAAISWRAVGLGLLTGLWVSLIFAFLPLLRVRRVSPLGALRRDYDPPKSRDPLLLPSALLLAVSVIGLARLQVGNWPIALWFALGIGGALLVLWFASWLLVRSVRRWFPRQWPYVWRQGLANLYRPANQTVAVILAVGFGAFLLATLFIVQHNLLRQLELTGGPERANLVMFDIQSDQIAPLTQLLSKAGYPPRDPVPIVPMRIRSINGKPVMRPTVAGDTTNPWSGEGDRGWAVRREYRSTYRRELVGSEKLVAGKWFHETDKTEKTERTEKSAGPAASGRDTSPSYPSSPSSPSLSSISLEVSIASELGVTIGDSITWDVQGVEVPTVIGSVREVDWARFEPNFFAVFEPGVLESAPQTAVLLIRVVDPAARGRIQRAVAERFANVTTIDLASMQQTIERLVNQVVMAIRFMALFSLVTGAIVLAGAIATSRYQRTREAALLRALGATTQQVVRIAFAEYFALGLLSATVGVGLSLLSAWLLGRFVFETPFAAPAELLGLFAAVAFGAVAIGMLNSADVARRRPLEVLRAE